MTKVVIFSDCQKAILRIDGFRRTGITMRGAEYSCV